MGKIGLMQITPKPIVNRMLIKHSYNPNKNSSIKKTC